MVQIVIALIRAIVGLLLGFLGILSAALGLYFLAGQDAQLLGSEGFLMLVGLVIAGALGTGSWKLLSGIGRRASAENGARSLRSSTSTPGPVISTVRRLRDGHCSVDIVD